MTADHPMVAHLTAALAKSEALALAATHRGAGEWVVGQGPEDDLDVFELSSPLGSAGRCQDDGHKPNRCDDVLIASADDCFGANCEQVVRFIVANDPASVLRQVAGARRMMKIHTPLTIGGDEFGCSYCENARDWPCGMLEIEAERWGWTG